MSQQYHHAHGSYQAKMGTSIALMLRQDLKTMGKDQLLESASNIW